MGGKFEVTQQAVPSEASDALQLAPIPIVLIERRSGSLEATPNDISRLLSEAGPPWFPLDHIERWEDALGSIDPGRTETRALVVDGLDRYGRRWNLENNRTTWSVTMAHALDGTWAVFAIDTTGQYRYAEMLEEVLASRNAAYENLAQVAHELRQPVTAVSGLSRVIADEPSDPGVGEIASLIQSESEGMAALIEDLMTAGLVSAQRMRVDITPTPAEDVARDLERLASTFLDTDVAVESDLGASPEVEVFVDSRRLTQVVRGLIHNAIKYGGPHIVVRSSVTDDRFEVEVSDDGAGVPAHEIEEIFQPFSKGEAAATKGTGIGLAVARSIVADMGGLLEYRPGDPGAVFAVTLHVRSGSTDTEVLRAGHERDELLAELVGYDRDAARIRLNRLAFRHRATEVVEEVVRPVMYEVGEQWARGDVSVSQEHHASSVVQNWLLEAMARSRPWRRETVVCVSSPGGHHELGTAAVAVAFSEAGYRVIYLGRGVPVDDLVDTITTSGAAAVMISITLHDQLDGLSAITAALEAETEDGFVVGFGGNLFAHGFPAEGLPGTFLGRTAREAVAALDEILESRAGAPS